jgi:hypothetical protein
MSGTIVEDSAYGFHVIDLFSCVEVKEIYEKGGSWARGGHYSTVEIKQTPNSTPIEIKIDSKEFDRYKICIRNKITTEEYDAYLRVKHILDGR